MELNIYNIYESLILESVGRSQIIDSINQPYRVKIYYQGENEQTPNWRFIDPYVLGTSTAGNEIIRAFQSFGFTTTEGSKWKTFRVDRILQWQPTKYHLGKKPIDAYGNNIPPYRLDGGDAKMTNIVAFRKFGETKRDDVMQQQVNTFNQNNAQSTKPSITPTPKTTVKPTTNPIPQQKQPITPKQQNIQPEPKIEPQVKPELPPIAKQPIIKSNPTKDNEINKKI